MGLDMYLSVRKYVSNYDWNGMERKPNPQYDKLVETGGMKKYVNISERGHGASVEVVSLYWRKENAIHQWFIDNCADGIDDCRPVYVSRNHLEKLLERITYVLDNRDEAPEELPTQSGFFFGATEYNDWYWEGLMRTQKELDTLLKRTKDEEDSISFIYEASW